MTRLPTGVWFFPEVKANALVDAVVHADRIGLDGIWVGDEGPARDPFAILAAAAVRTTSVELGVGVTNPYLRHPGATAATALTIHDLSAGRFKLGIGAGGQMALGPYGLAAERPLAAVRDAIRITRAVGAGSPTDGYEPPDLAVTEQEVGVPMPIFVGARGERLNRLASEVADGAFVAGMPPFRYAEVLGWVRSVRPVPVELYPSVAFTAAAVERHRPELIWSLHDTPADVRQRFDLDAGAISAAATALRAGDTGPARRIVTDELIGELLLVGTPAEVGGELAALARRHHPSAIGLALLQDDLTAGIDMAAEAFDAMHVELGEI
ncbi:MAG: LLM class flavin-dependent oxidoreductase [Ilumatobacteraceae bacterium]